MDDGDQRNCSDPNERVEQPRTMLAAGYSHLLLLFELTQPLTAINIYQDRQPTQRMQEE